MTGNVTVITEEDYLASKGCGMAALGEPALHRMPGQSAGHASRERNLRNQAEKDRAWMVRREELRQEYREKLALGEIRMPTRIERLKQVAAGRPDNESVQAARRLLAKKGIIFEDA